MSTFEKMQEQYREMQEALKRDIRPMISRANGYNPEKDQFKEWEYKEYPKIINRKHPMDGRPDSVIVQSREEENQLLGRKPEPAKAATVDIANLGQNETVTVKKRGRPRKEERQPLPPNLE